MTPAVEGDPVSLTGRVAVGRLGLPVDAVGPAIFLAPDAAARVTGTFVPVDGGNLTMTAGGTIGRR